MIGLLCAPVPLEWLWTLYLVKWDSTTSPRSVCNGEIGGADGIVNPGAQGAIPVRCYELRVTYQFRAAGASHLGNKIRERCGRSALKDLRVAMLAHPITVGYSADDSAISLMLEPVSRLKQKMTGGWR